MNDLERDLHELFATKAREVNASPELPPKVLRRGRRRQATTVVAGTAGGLAVIAVAVAAVLTVTGGPDRLPADRGNGAPERVTSIGGVPITAPAGWTLVDDWPLATSLVTSQQACTSSSSLGENCTEIPVDLPAGVPVLQMANWEIPLLETVCGLGDEPPTDIPGHGVAVYVAMLPDQRFNADEWLEQCPAAGDFRGEVNFVTFVARAQDRTITNLYLGVAVAGAAATEEDVAVATRTLHGYEGIEVVPIESLGTGPGYVLAAGGAADVSWRFEAGIESMSDGPAQPAAALVVTSANEWGSESVLPMTGDGVDHTTHLFDIEGTANYVAFGTAGAGVGGVDIVTPDGTTRATSFPWPAGLIGSLDTEPIEGTLWIAETAAQGEVIPVVSGIDVTSQPSPPATAGRIETRVVDGVTVGTMEAFGRTIDISIDTQGRVMVEGDDSLLDLEIGTGVRVDLPDGTIMVDRLADDERTWVTLADGSRIDGAWIPYPDVAGIGAPASSLWITALPGSGTGLEHGGPLPLAISWPTHETATEGDVIAAGADRRSSWAIRWLGGCPVLDVVATTTGRDDGTDGCVIAWDGQVVPSYIDGIYGRDVATIAVTGPGGMELEPANLAAEDTSVQCGIDVSEPGWEGTGICVVVMDPGHRVELTPISAEGDALNTPFVILVKDGTMLTSA